MKLNSVAQCVDDQRSTSIFLKGASSFVSLVRHVYFSKALNDQFARLPERYKRIFKNLRAAADAKDVTLLLAFMGGKAVVREHNFGYIFNPTTKVSFVYPFFNKADTILRSIESIKSQRISYPDINIEIIVVDDGSEQPTIAEKLPSDVIYVWRNKFNYGISRSRNLGAKIANGEYLVFIDPDVVLNTNYINSLLAQFQQFGHRTVLTGYLRDYFYEGCEDPRTAFGVWEKPDVATTRFLHLAGGNMAIHRDLFAEVGGFDEDLIYGEVEDTLFGYLVGQLPSTHMVYSLGLTVTHIPHAVGLAHKKPTTSWDVVAYKYPEAYKKIVIEGMK